MSEPAQPADVPAWGGRHGGGEPAYGTIPLLAAIAVLAVLAWPTEKLPVAAILRGIQLIAAGAFMFAAVFRRCTISHVAVDPISQP